MQKHVYDPRDTISYKYTVHSNKFAAPETEYPSIAFQYDLSPISIVVQQTRGKHGQNAMARSRPCGSLPLQRPTR